MDSTPVTFIERSGAGAEASLQRLRRRLEDAGLTCRPLRSRGRDDLHLLVVEGDPELAEDEARGASVWRFEAADPSARPVPTEPAAARADAGPATGDA